MDRTKVMQAVMNVFRQQTSASEAYFKESLKRIPDMDLIVLANQMGVDTDALLAVPQ